MSNENKKFKYNLTEWVKRDGHVGPGIDVRRFEPCGVHPGLDSPVMLLHVQVLKHCSSDQRLHSNKLHNKKLAKYSVWNPYTQSNLMWHSLLSRWETRHFPAIMQHQPQCHSGIGKIHGAQRVHYYMSHVILYRLLNCQESSNDLTTIQCCYASTFW